MSDNGQNQGFAFDPSAIEGEQNQPMVEQNVVEQSAVELSEPVVHEPVQQEFVTEDSVNITPEQDLTFQPQVEEQQMEYVEQEPIQEQVQEFQTESETEYFQAAEQQDFVVQDEPQVEMQDFSNLQEEVQPEQTELNDDPMNREVVPFQQGVDIIKLVDDMFQSSIAQGASDVHIEPFEQFLAIRFRIDGDFVEYLNFASEYAESILTRIEVLAGLKLDKNRLPQDGKINYSSTSGQRVDMRVSTFPTMYGNKVCIRLLVKEDSVKTLESLGYDQEALDIITKNLQRTFGMVLMTGPTGSGKSTTLFGMLSTYNPFEYNISTLEDPIEYFIPGVNQSQVNAEIGYDFPDGLRTLVRQDPDIIMVGEIRDKVTASLAVNAAITGHLVFSTLHANTASATIQRLMNMDVDHFLVASALNLIVSQRLVRRICPHCKEEFTPDSHTIENVKAEMANIDDVNIDTAKFYRGAGCDHCKGSGYKGRVAIYELLEITPEISKVVIEKQGVAEEIEKVAVEQGMVTIKQHGIMAALKGDTTLEEVLIASDSLN